ncbi:amidase [Streptomyces brasiliensis]|uniref:N-acetylmuramoyl-L-alanine amidase n=1 Tax=Streptomyces brasiliensis TaxID=1954 RepID=A0A917KJ75_9ACTN|nr:amidase [Streptomyces brasiliensis]
MICVTALAALLVPLLAGPDDDVDVAADLSLQNEFAAAAQKYHVPRSVLMGVSYQQTRWDSHPGTPSVGGGYGPMHLVDVRPVRPVPAPSVPPHGSPPPLAGAPDGAAANAPGAAGQLTDLRRAARLIGEPARRLRTDAAANVRGGAALLAATQKQLGKPLSENPGDWWDAVAAFSGLSGTSDEASAATYADDVFTVIRKGAKRTTDTGQDVTLPPNPNVRPHPTVRDPNRREQVECPPELTCSWLGAPYTEVNGGATYGNYDPADRPRDQKIEYIVIHDTEASLKSMLLTVQDPTEASWNYSVRSSDGHITQHVRTKDEAWHSGNQFVNASSIGVEHEGFLTQPDTWYSEQMYRSSARLVRFLAKKYGIPLDRQHIIGHDNVPSPTAGTIPQMHEDPGPFWDWRHYFDLLGAPLKATAGPDSPVLMALPDYATHKPRYYGCNGHGVLCPPHGSSAVRLHTEPFDDAPLIQDPGRHPDGAESTEDVSDLGSRISAGQKFAVAGRNGDWTAIWFQGHKAWFKNPEDHPTAVGSSGKMVTPKDGTGEIPVYGRPLPEKSAYPYGMEPQTESPLPYSIQEGQRYVAGSVVSGAYVDRSAFGQGPGEVIKGNEKYYEIQLGHRLAYVRASDVDVVNPSAGAAGLAQQ